MNKETEALIAALLGFSVICFVVILVSYAVFFMLAKNSRKLFKKNHYILGTLAGFSPLEAFSFSLLTVRQIFFVWALFQGNITIIYLIMLIAPGLMYNLLNRRFGNLFVDILNCGLLYIALIAKNIFYAYVVNVNEAWHVIMFIALLIIFSLLYSFYFYLRGVRNIVDNNVKHLYHKKN